jgi:hypothetical protein
LLREKVARMLRAREPLILNWFRAKGEVSSAEGSFARSGTTQKSARLKFSTAFID